MSRAGDTVYVAATCLLGGFSGGDTRLCSTALSTTDVNLGVNLLAQASATIPFVSTSAWAGAALGTLGTLRAVALTCLAGAGAQRSGKPPAAMTLQLVVCFNRAQFNSKGLSLSLTGAAAAFSSKGCACWLSWVWAIRPLMNSV